ncbi:dentin sialophosphoprotein [Senna tora]|uniref:Dentin sialophosphoprotein n=1 Tax=Senna tora TaxID=362788 RepID=A0A834TWV0_9FABA|nr:dentin sialophosphoprotein [Senna tora]
MTLEDFFTLTEMKDGLTTPSRVQELVSVMQKEKESFVKNVGDTTRQWAAVASTIAATENKDCLDLFIQLDGLWFINKWLKDAQNFGTDTNDGFVEESITALLRAVGKLHLDSEKSTSSGIWVTVRNLLGHRSSRVQERARILFDGWKVGGNSDADIHDMEVDKVNDGSEKIVREECQPSAVNEAVNDIDHASGLVEGEKSPLRSTDTLPPERVVNVLIQSSSNQLHSPRSSDCEDVKLRSTDHLAYVSTAVEDKTISDGSCSISVPKQGNVEGQSDVTKLNDLSEMEKQEQIDNGPAEKVAGENSSASTKPELNPFSEGATEAKDLESVKDPALQHNIENNEDAVHHKIITSSVRTATSDRRSRADDIRAIKSSSPQLLQTVEKDDDFCSNAFHRSSISDSYSGKPEVIETSLSKTDYVRAAKESKGHSSNEDTSKVSDSTKPGRVPKSLNMIDKKSSDIELEYGMVDALEVARQVAQEVRREVCSSSSEKISEGGNQQPSSPDSIKRRVSKSPNMIDKKSSDIELEYGIVDALEVARQVAQEVRREVCSSSSEKTSEGGNQQPGSPDSIKREDVLTSIPPREVPSRQSHSAEAYPEEEEEGCVSTSDIIEAEPECIPARESSQVTETAQDPGGNSEKIRCSFDLNEEVVSDDVDVSSVNTMSTTPISVVSASNSAATSELPAAPLHFEGTLGWKGSATASAFCPASPCKNSDSKKNLSVGVNSDISKQRQDWLNIDLNVAEGEDGLGKQNAESSSLPSGQSSLELGSKRSSRLELDLNSIGDDVDAQPSDHRKEEQLFNGRNGLWRSSPASSLSSMQPSVRNIDLNDRPYLQTDLVDQGHRASRSDCPVISILGTKVEVGRKDIVPHSLSLPNGKAMGPVVDLTMSRAGGVLGMGPTASYNHSNMFGYNGLASASGLSYSSSVYGSSNTIPYMVDSRGAPVVPQVVGSSSSLPSSYSQPSFIMSMTGAQLGLNGVGTSRPNFDLNSGFMIEGGNRDALTARQFFFPGQSRAMEEHLRTIPQPSGSIVGVKRKEPDSGWETYPMSHKQPQPPWK